MSDINEEESLNTEDEPTTKEDELSTTEDEIINSNNETTTTINSNNEQPTKDEQPTKPKRKIIPPTRPKREPLPKVRLTTAERNKIIYDYERGVSNPNWEVIITKTNKKIVRRKKDPAATYSPISGLTKSEPKSSSPPLIQTQTPQTSSLPQTSTPPSNKDWMSSIQYYNVQNSFNEQLMKQIDELNNKITHQNNKHKKLKTKYKKLKRSIFSDDSDNETQPININEPDEPAENANLDTSPEGLKAHGATSTNDNVNVNEQVEYEPQPQPVRQRKLNLRDTIDFTKYGFSPL